MTWLGLNVKAPARMSSAARVFAQTLPPSEQMVGINSLPVTDNGGPDKLDQFYGLECDGHTLPV